MHMVTEPTAHFSPQCGTQYDHKLMQQAKSNVATLLNEDTLMDASPSVNSFVKLRSSRSCQSASPKNANRSGNMSLLFLRMTGISMTSGESPLRHSVSRCAMWFAPVLCSNLKVRETGFRNRSFTA